MKGKTAYGCSLYNKTCNFKLDFTLFGKKLTSKQTETILKKGKSSLIKGFVINGAKAEGYIELNEAFEAIFTEKKKQSKAKIKQATPNTQKSESLRCPKCGKGIMLKGKQAYGCSEYKSGCKYVLKFSDLKSKFGTEILTAEMLK